MLMSALFPSAVTSFFSCSLSLWFNLPFERNCRIMQRCKCDGDIHGPVMTNGKISKQRLVASRNRTIYTTSTKTTRPRSIVSSAYE